MHDWMSPDAEISCFLFCWCISPKGINKSECQRSLQTPFLRTSLSSQFVLKQRPKILKRLMRSTFRPDLRGEINNCSGEPDRSQGPDKQLKAGIYSKRRGIFHPRRRGVSSFCRKSSNFVPSSFSRGQFLLP